MAVKYARSKNNSLGILGGLATIGGALTGAPWLSALGTGIGMMNGQGEGGQSQGLGGSFADILNGIVCGGWYNPASGSIARKSPDPQLSEEELIKKWNPFNTGGYQSWLR